MVEVDRVERFDQREIEHREIERLLVADGAWLCQVSLGVSTMSPGPNTMFSPSTPVKLPLPLRPKRTALGECLCGGMISLASFRRYAVYIVLTVARARRQPGIDEDQPSDAPSCPS